MRQKRRILLYLVLSLSSLAPGSASSLLQISEARVLSVCTFLPPQIIEKFVSASRNNYGHMNARSSQFIEKDMDSARVNIMEGVGMVIGKPNYQIHEGEFSSVLIGKLNDNGFYLQPRERAPRSHLTNPGQGTDPYPTNPQRIPSPDRASVEDLNKPQDNNATNQPNPDPEPQTDLNPKPQNMGYDLYRESLMMAKSGNADDPRSVPGSDIINVLHYYRSTISLSRAMTPSLSTDENSRKINKEADILHPNPIDHKSKTSEISTSSSQLTQSNNISPIKSMAGSNTEIIIQDKHDKSYYK